MTPKYLLILAICSLFYACDKKGTGIEISLSSKNKLDTIYISELITEKPIAQIYEKNDRRNVQLNNPAVTKHTYRKL